MKTSPDERHPSPGRRGWSSVLGVEGVEGLTPSVDVLLVFFPRLFPSPVRNKGEIGMFTASSSVRFPKSHSHENLARRATPISRSEGLEQRVGSGGSRRADAEC